MPDRANPTSRQERHITRPSIIIIQKKDKGTWQMPMHLISSQSAITLEPLIVRRIYKCPAGREIEMGTIDVAS